VRVTDNDRVEAGIEHPNISALRLLGALLLAHVDQCRDGSCNPADFLVGAHAREPIARAS